MSTPARAPLPVPTMMDMGSLIPKGAGHAMNQYSVNDGKKYRGAGTKTTAERDRSGEKDSDTGDEVGGKRVGKLLDGSASPLRFADHLHDLGQEGLARRSARIGNYQFDLYGSSVVA